MKSDQSFNLYKLATAKTMVKAAKVTDKDIIAALLGAAGGGGIGYLSHLLTPKDEDEDQKKRILSHVLAGVATGGLAGYGMSKLRSTVKDTPLDALVSPSEPVKERTFRDKIVDPDWNTALLGTSALTSSPFVAGVVSDTLRDRSIDRVRSLADPRGRNRRFVGPGSLIEDVATKGSKPSSYGLRPAELAEYNFLRRIYNESQTPTARPSLWKWITSRGARDAARAENARLFGDLLEHASPGSVRPRGRITPTFSQAKINELARHVNISKAVRSLSGKKGIVRSATHSKLGKVGLLSTATIAALLAGARQIALSGTDTSSKK